MRNVLFVLAYALAMTQAHAQDECMGNDETCLSGQIPGVARPEITLPLKIFPETTMPETYLPYVNSAVVPNP